MAVCLNPGLSDLQAYFSTTTSAACAENKKAINKAVYLSGIFSWYFSHFLQGAPIIFLARKKITSTGFINKNKTNEEDSLFQKTKGERKQPVSFIMFLKEVSTGTQGGTVLPCESLPCVHQVPYSRYCQCPTSIPPVLISARSTASCKHLQLSA